MFNTFEFISGLTPWIVSLKAEKRPVLLYGMGDGAEKANEYLQSHGVKISGVVASEGFVRGQSFSGYEVRRISDAERELGSLCLVLCFGLEEERHDVLSPLKERGHRVISPNLPLFGREVCDFGFIAANADRFDRLYQALADDTSRKVLESLMEYCVTGDPEALEPPASDLPPDGFYTRGGIYVDVGAYDGDTVIEFAAASGGNYERIIAFEPDSHSFKKLVANTSGLPRLTAVNKLVGDRNGEVPFSHGKGRASNGIDAAGNGTAECVTLDAFCGFTHIHADAPNVGAVKIDAEGMDESVLCGAANTIYRCRSGVCVAVYHRAGDILTFPRLLKSQHYDYRLYLRKKPCLPAWDVFLYAL